MKNLIQKITFITLLSSSFFAASSVKKLSANAQTSVPITWVSFNVGYYHNMMMAELTVPDYKTTIAAGGGLRRYDAHMAKMFELTHYECLDQQANRNWNGIRWRYYAGNGSIDMGAFNISCNLARDIATAYGLGRYEMTSVTYYRADTTINVPKLNIVGGKVPTWLRFTRRFKPVAQIKPVEDFTAISSVITQTTGQKVVQIEPYTS